MTHLENILANELPNLDAFVTPKEAQDMRAEFKRIAAGMTELASYCEAKGHAMELRAKGNIPLAMRFEQAAETVYARLPEWAKW